MKRLFITYLIIFSSIVAFADNQISVLSYNLYPTTNKKDDWKLQTVLLQKILNKSDATIYSIGKNKQNNAMPLLKTNFERPGNTHKVVAKTTSDYLHYIAYDTTKVSLKSSIAIPKRNHTILHYSFLVKHNKKSLDVFYFKLSEKKRFYYQYQTVIDIINNLNIRDRVILLGGSDSEKNINTFYTLKNTNGLEFRSPLSYKNLYDDNQRLLQNPTQDFAYLSSDLWNLEQPLYYKLYSATLRSELFDKKTSNKLIKEQCSFPFSFILQSTNSKLYSTPALRITSQNKQVLNFTLQWSKNTDLDLEIISMIGNVFTKKTMEYNGGVQDLSIDISDYPTGIFILKISSKDNETLLRKFTKY